MYDSGLELMARGWSARREGNYDDARRDIARAITFFRETGDRRHLVDALGRLGHIEMDRERWDAAHAAYEEAITICRERGDWHGLAHKTRHLGDVHRHTGQLEEALSCYRESVSLYRRHANPPQPDFANAIRSLALAEQAAGKVDDARQLSLEAQALYRSLGLQEGVDECAKLLERLGHSG